MQSIRIQNRNVIKLCIALHPHLQKNMLCIRQIESQPSYFLNHKMFLNISLNFQITKMQLGKFIRARFILERVARQLYIGPTRHVLDQLDEKN